MKNIWNKYKREFVVLIATIAMCVVFTALNKNFLNYSNFITVLQQMVLNGILAVGMMFTIITGGIDLSVGCTYAITGIVVASCTVTYGMNPVLAIVVGIVIGAVLGAFNGFLINKLKLQPFIATLGTMSLYRGIAYVVTGGVPVTNVPESYRNIFNGEIFAGVRSMIMLASLGSAEATAGQAYETNAIAAAAIGGTRMAGGKGTALGTFFGALMLAVLKVGMVVINVDSFWQFVVTGIIIIVASYFEFIQQDIKGFVSRHKKTA